MKLLFIILATLSGLCLPADEPLHMGIISSSRYCGEREVAWRIKIAGESLGWQVTLDENEGRLLRTKKDLDFLICVLPKYKYKATQTCNYLTLFHPFNYLSENRELKPQYYSYSGYLLTIPDGPNLEEFFSEKNVKFNWIPFYPSVHYVEYKKLPLTNLVVMIPTWGNRNQDIKFRTLYMLLSQTDQVKFYGSRINANLVEKGYEGPIPFNGVSVIHVLQQHGIVLVFHSEIHNAEGIPSSRIFEGAAASAVIISDQNAFVKEHFKETVFYIDTTLSSEEIYSQIMHHLNTIHANPQKALDMAKKAHEIFIDKFEMSKQLQLLETMHNTLISDTQ